ncbi:MAG TPA: pyruvate kinase [Thermomicrobiales bacterium]|nr:pyruvate kinase [Thermomicrobiales bacterium]
MSVIAERTRRRTKIVCTIGPSSSSPEMLEALMKAGMDVARLNFSHGTKESHAAVVERIRTIGSSLGVAVAILQDLPGPKTRTVGPRNAPVELKEGERFTLTTRDVPGDAGEVSVTLPTLPQDVRPGDAILLDDGKIELRVLNTGGQDVETVCITGGPLGSSKGINVPGVTLSVSSLTERDIEFLRFGLEMGVDIVALSFVRSVADVNTARQIINETDKRPLLIAKLEKHEALDNLHEIMAAVDGLMVARGDLGVEIPIERVPIEQKRVIAAANRAGKPVITATQMLESMITNPRPTRAEVTDVANAIFDGTDAVMLSGETASGEYPAQAVRMMDRVAREVEPILPYTRMLQEKEASLEEHTFDAISFDAVHTAEQLHAAAIVAFTQTGSTVRRVAKYRPRAPILGITTDQATWNRLSLSWGVIPYLVPEFTSVEAMTDEARLAAMGSGLAKPGDRIVIVAGVPVGISGRTNLLRVETLS